MKLIFVPLVLLLLWILRHNIRKSSIPNRQSVKQYLDREDEANSTRRQDISDLPYIQVPLDTFPLHITLNDAKKQSEIAKCRQELTELAKLPMLNLIGKSNTELKLLYGPANLPALINCDQNYSRYLRTLQALADCIYDTHPSEAVSIAEYCLTIGTDISGTYELLGRYYIANDRSDAFEQLYTAIPDPASVSGRTISRKLDALKNLFS